MDCELCGRSGALVKVRIDRAEFNVCEPCSKHGKRVDQPIVSNYIPRTSKTSEEFVIENFGRLVQQARNKLNITQEELALKINEHPSVVRAAEAEKILDIRVMRKLEKALRLQLVHFA